MPHFLKKFIFDCTDAQRTIAIFVASDNELFIASDKNRSFAGRKDSRFLSVAKKTNV